MAIQIVRRPSLGLTLSILLTLTMPSCAPTKTETRPGTADKISTVSDSTAACEQNLRSRFMAKSLRMTPVRELDQPIANANTALDTMPDVKYGLRQMKEQTNSVSVNYGLKNKNSSAAYEYELSLNAADAKSPMNLSISYSKTEGPVQLKVGQSFQINDRCELQLSRSFQSQLQKETSDYSFASTTYFVDGGSAPKSERFKVPAGGELQNLTLNEESMDSINENSYSFMPGLGLAGVKLRPKKLRSVSAFNMVFNFSGIDMDILINGKVLTSYYGGEQKELAVEYTESVGQVFWKLPLSIWKDQNLGSSRDINAQMDFKLPKDYLLEHASYRLELQAKPDYDHLSAYWLNPEFHYDEATKNYSAVVTENPTPTTAGAVTKLDLVSNATIQTNLPQIQAIAKSILAQAPNSRRDQVALILKYLKSNYAYDHDMVNIATVRALSTEEALNRHKGVCQHYAVIFTAIARALKIPSRIVVGYLLTGTTPDFHAWVEASIDPGMWQVIEPQSEFGLTQTHTRYYLPMYRGGFLEDKTASISDDYFKMIMKYSFLPL
jgi:hypothetical protein